MLWGNTAICGRAGIGTLCWGILGSAGRSSPNSPLFRTTPLGAPMLPARAAMSPCGGTSLPVPPEAAPPLFARAGLRGRTRSGRGLRASAAIPPPPPGSAASRRRHDGADDPARDPEGPQRLGDPDRHHPAVPRHDPVRLARCAPGGTIGEGRRGCGGDHRGNWGWGSGRTHWGVWGRPQGFQGVWITPLTELWGVFLGEVRGQEPPKTPLEGFGAAGAE